jgi:hypothetical protein
MTNLLGRRSVLAYTRAGENGNFDLEVPDLRAV